VWTKTGSRDERRGKEGLCHFLEHMLFKGTSQRSAFEISQEIEKIGGSLDAFTTKETMCLYAHVLENHRTVALDLLSDMLNNAIFAQDQVSIERQVVLEEINDVMDAPDDLVHDLFASVVFPAHPLGRPVLGYPNSVAGFSRDDLLRYSRKTFKASNIIVAVYGNISSRELREACARLFDFPQGSVKHSSPRLGRFKPERRIIRRKLHNQHVCLGNRTFSYLEDRRFPLMVLTTLIGGGMSSRLFQRVREKMGLTYSIFTDADHARDTGLMATYMSVRPKHTAAAINAVLEEYHKIRTGDLSPGELEDTKEQLKGRILLGLETSTAKMMRMARNELYYGRQITEKELLRRIDAVALDDIFEVADKTLDLDDLCVVSLGSSTAGLPT
jgi:predicted Zn-dependent peptidase